MSVSALTSREGRARLLAALFLSASLLTALAAPADAAPRSKCRTNPERYSFFHGKCMSDKRIERLQNHNDGPNHG
ncbi:MAG TPA: hypothetical protein VKA73_12635 [Rubrobacter sp.]|nr:hypothetical protein [Rubrobacter sp.]